MNAIPTTPIFLTIFGASWLFTLLLIYLLPNGTRKLIGWALPVLGIISMITFGVSLLPWQRLLSSTLGLLCLLKATILFQQPQQEIRSYSKLGVLLYMTIWPGMNPLPFRKRQENESKGGTDDTTRPFLRGIAYLSTGLSLGITITLFQPKLGGFWVGWLGIAAFLMTIHFGYSEVLTSLLRLAGWQVGNLFNQPLQSRSLHDFWSHRWNLAFVEMDTILFLKPLMRRFGGVGALLAVFLVSGTLHEAGISYPAFAGWGLPLLYFALQGLLVVLERKVLLVEKRWPFCAGRLWTWCCVLLPLPLLFHTPFRQTLIVPFFSYLHHLLMSHSIRWYFDLALRLAAIGHFCILAASFQVPSRLGWREDLAKLTPFNRKIMWTYGVVIVLLIIAFGILTLVLHDELLRGDRAALGLAALIGGFWGVRVLVDFFYFKHEDWPPGALFVIGHVLLTGLFIALVCTYLGLLIWHLGFG